VRHYIFAYLEGVAGGSDLISEAQQLRSGFCLLYSVAIIPAIEKVLLEILFSVSTNFTVILESIAVLFKKVHNLS